MTKEARGFAFCVGGRFQGQRALDGLTTRKRNKDASPEFVASPKKEVPIPEFLYSSGAGAPVAARAGRLYDVFLTIFNAEPVINQDKQRRGSVNRNCAGGSEV